MCVAAAQLTVAPPRFHDYLRPRAAAEASRETTSLFDTAAAWLRAAAFLAAAFEPFDEPEFGEPSAPELPEWLPGPPW